MAAWRQAISRNLKEIRIHLCQTSKSSQGVRYLKIQFFMAGSPFVDFAIFCRDFLEKHYVELKQQNPQFPILIRECSSIEPKLYGRFGKSLSAV